MTDIYRVTAPYVTLKSKDPVTGGDQVLGYFEGALVPETVDLEDLARHIRKGMVEKVEGADLKAVHKQQAAEAKAEKAAEAPEDKEGAEAVKQAQAEADAKAEAEKLAADKTTDKAEAEKPDKTTTDKAPDKADLSAPKAKGGGS